MGFNPMDPLGLFEGTTTHQDVVKPAYDGLLEGQVVSWDEVALLTPQTAHDSIMTGHIIGMGPLSNYQWKYQRFSLRDLDMDGWVSTLAKYAALTPQEMNTRALQGELPKEDIEIIMGVRPGMTSEDIAKRLSMDVVRVQQIELAIKKTGTYFPPILTKDLDSLDGAHRMAALYHLYGPNLRIFAWRQV